MYEIDTIARINDPHVTIRESYITRRSLTPLGLYRLLAGCRSETA